MAIVTTPVPVPEGGVPATKYIPPKPPPPLKTYDDIPASGRLKLLLWGRSKVGKTALAGTWPGLLYVDTDFEGLKVYKNPKNIARFGKPDLIGWNSFDDQYDDHGLFTSAEAVWDIINFINAYADNEGVQTIVIDSLTTLQELMMHIGLEVGGQQSDKGKSRSYTLKNARASEHRVALATQGDYGAEMNVFMQIMNQIISIPKNIICIAHEREETRENVITAIEPYLIGSAVRGMIAKWFDEVWYLDSRMDGKRELTTEPRGLIKVVGSRLLGLDTGLIDPTYKLIKEKSGMK